MSAEIEKFEQVERFRSGEFEVCVLASDYDALLSLARKQAQELAKMPKWIAVEQEMPDMGVWVWVYAISTSLDWSQSFFQTSGRFEGLSDEGEAYFSTVNSAQFPVTHWAPLLTPPSTEETL